MRPFLPPMALSASWCSWVRWWIGSGETRNAEVETRNRRAGAGRACSAFRVSRSAFTPAPPPARAADALSHPQPPRALMSKLPVILAITGASGAPYGVRLLEMLVVHNVPTWLLVSSHGWRLLGEECGITDDRALKKATGGDWASVRMFDDTDRGAEPASGAVKTAGLVICPCSMGTVAAIAHGTSRSLIDRAADVELEALAPVTAVYGNADPPELRARLPQVAHLELDGFDIVVTHGDQFGHPTPAKLHEAFPRAEIIVYGHTHKPLLELVDRTVTVMNPGGAGHARFNLKPSVGIMELEPGIPPRARLVGLTAP